MNKKLFKKHLAGFMAASVVFTTLAPAMSVQAASGVINFDAGIFTKYTGIEVPSITGTAPNIIGDTAPYNDVTNYPKDNIDATRLEMPWWSANDEFAAGVWAGKTFDNTTFPGYKIDGWYKTRDDKAMGFKATRIPTRFPESEVSYFADLVSDGTEYDYKIEYEGLPNSIKPDTETGRKRVLESILAVPKTIPGYKLTETPGFKFYEPGNTFTNENTPIASANNYDFRIYNGNVSGKMTNKDLAVKFKYGVDTDAKFRLTIVHHILDRDGNEKNPKDDRYDFANSFNAYQDITGVMPKQELITPRNAGEPARYLLLNEAGKQPRITDIALDAHGQLQDLTAKHENHILGPQDTNMAIAGDGTVTGKMPNQSAQVHYYYKPNPAYKNTVIVKYENEVGQDITADIVRKLNEQNAETVLDNYDTAHPDKFYKVEGGIARKISPQQSGNIPAPSLAPVYKNGNSEVSASISEGSEDFAADLGQFAGNGWTESRPHFELRMGNEGSSIEILVKYTHNPASIKSITLNIENSGKLMVNDNEEYDIIEHPEHDIILEKAADGSVTLEESMLPQMKPNPGYMVDGWYYKGNKVENWPLVMPDEYKLTAKFVKDPSKWINFNFAVGNDVSNPLMTPAAPATFDVLTLDEVTGDPLAPGTITWTYLKDRDGVPTVDIDDNINYKVTWLDDAGAEVEDNTDISGHAGRTFTAYVVPTAPAQVNDPSATFNIDNRDGTPNITVDPLNPDSSVKYVITDGDGNVVAVVPGADVLRDGGVITGDFLKPGKEYKVYEALPTADATVGQPLTETYPEISNTPSAGRIPVAVDPMVTEDTANPGRASIKINPVTPNTEYGLIDSNGNVVYPFASPTGDTMVFPNLDPDTTYTVVARPVGDPATETDSLPGLNVDTDNLGLNVNSFDLSVVLPSGMSLTEFKVSGVDKDVNDPNSFKAIPKNADIIIDVAPSNPNGEFFERWAVINGTPANVQTIGNKYIFKMPAQPVKLQAVYGQNVEWDPTHKNSVDTKHIGAEYPAITDPGRYRVSVTKQNPLAHVVDAVKEIEGNTYTGLWLAKVEVEKYNPTNATWEAYTGNVPDIVTTFETGALLTTNEYHVYKVDIATPVNAQRVNGDFETDLNSATYQGQFDLEAENGQYYIFGYSIPDVFQVKVKDTRDNSLVTTLRIGETETVNDKRSLYESSIRTGSYVDVNGITWEYVGLSKDADEYDPYDENRAVTSDMTIYLYYGHDKPARRQAKDALEDEINLVDSLSRQTSNREVAGLYDQAADVARAILQKTSPRKASTPELEAALAALKQAIADIQNRNRGGSSGGGRGSGGSGSSNRTPGLNTTRSYSVGSDGHWQLIDPVNHKWIFRLNSGSNITGWANLYYTYNGVTKIERYHFAKDGIMDSGWFLDENNKWYYLSEVHDGFFGKTIKGWHKDPHDGKWYYLSPLDGHMLLGWNKINDSWYYLNPIAPKVTWNYNDVTSKWIYNNPSNSRPYGSMYENEMTPDNYKVNTSGAWVIE